MFFYIGIPKKWKIASCIILTVILAFTFNKIDYTLKTKNEMLINLKEIFNLK